MELTLLLADRFKDSRLWGRDVKKTLWIYTCAQWSARQNNPQKVDDVSKQRDKQQMPSFECRGRVTMLVNNTTAQQYVDITVSHHEDHVPYCVISLPPDVQKLIEDSPDKDPTQIWNEILRKYPTPNFTRDSVYQLWHRAKAKWTSAIDEIISARNLLKKGAKPGGLGEYCVEEIPIEEPEGLLVLAFSLPDMLENWRDRIREAAIDSAWGTNRAGYEIFAVLSEAYGLGLPLGYLCIKTTGESAEGSNQKVLEAFLKYFRDWWGLTVKVNLSDKNWPEIGACQRTWPDAKHQLCFWHCLRVVKKRLATLRRQPAPYNVQEAMAEFPFIEPAFLPISQQPISAPDIVASQKPIPRIVVRGLASTSLTEDLVGDRVASEAQSNRPRIVLRLAGKMVTILSPGEYRGVAGREETEEMDEMAGGETGENSENGENGESGKSDTATAGVEGNTAMSSKLGSDSSGDRMENVDDQFWRGVAREAKGCEQDVNEEDAPDWEFDDGEKKSKDPTYIFCPAPHRSALLHLYTRHFTRHPIFPARLGDTETAKQIRANAVKEMYFHCKRNSLAEVWAYMWTQWYSPKRWSLWACSSSPLLSRLHMTMTVENHWRQLKHQYLRFTHRPRLDHAIYVICTEMVPAYMVAASRLEDSHRLGRARQLTRFRVAFKENWKRKEKAKVSGCEYRICVKSWQCNCGGQETDPHHLCKHLVQAVPTPPPNFFTEVVWRRTMPLYRHPALHQLGTSPGKYWHAEDGSITDGDDHEGVGGHALLRKATRDEQGVGGWADVASGAAKNAFKRSRTRVDGESNAEAGPSRQRRLQEEEDDIWEEDTGQAEGVEASLSRLAKRLHQASDILDAQLPHENIIWMQNIRATLSEEWEGKLESLLTDVRKYERSGTNPTWPRNPKEQAASRHTMGYQLKSTHRLEHTST
ncbi:hypothetical protein FS837_007016 [Tulasnella sp. UAMH 9824]|nr:hypothetical protein FS837_007016 [Tulasnella sp. UAMH 9824]